MLPEPWNLKTAIASLLCLSSPACAFVIGNPAQPELTQSSLIRTEPSNWALRAAYVDDFIYALHVKNEFDFGPTNEKPPLVQFSTDAALITLTLWNRLDLYGIIGSSKLRMDDEIYTNSQLSWGFGTKILFFSGESLRIACDFKYFQSDQNPLFLVVDHMPLNVASDWTIRYEEYQASVGASYQTSWLCPYLHLTYIATKIKPTPFTFLVDVPGFNEPMDASIHSFDGIRRWGMAVGATLVGGSKITLAVESRFFNQNAVDANLEVRF